ncbi:MAG: hypothetical protein A2Z20_02880 [Bdellovibrionales bacterium RBG_16_40_8]|nr:MAG: hypothetical protein A2Z20_02880 [Bdellovibrionales bacterium RBG_16_40_8]
MPSQIESEQCQPVRIELQDANGNLVPFGTTTMLTLNPGNGGLFYGEDDDSCSGDNISEINFSAYDVHNVIYYKNTSAVGSTATVTAYTTGTPVISVGRSILIKSSGL